jgi:hypothetical protein
MEIKVLIATHKKVELPQDSIYLPIHVGKENKEDFGYIGDNSGENISYKNDYYSELSAIYWAWKNLNSDFVGLVHYRRFFAKSRTLFWKKEPLSSEDIIALCEKHDLILPNKRRYYIENLYSHYANTHDISHLDKTREIIEASSPEYLFSFDKVLKRKSAHMFNMFIMRKALFDDYCEWLFSILFQLEKQIDLTKLSKFDARLIGRVSELLLDVWVDKNQFQYKEVGLLEIGSRFWLKLRKFLAAKFLKRKYKQSS